MRVRYADSHIAHDTISKETCTGVVRTLGETIMALNRRRILHGASMGGLLLAAIGCGDEAAPAKPRDASKPGANAEVNSATGKIGRAHV